MSAQPLGFLLHTVAPRVAVSALEAEYDVDDIEEGEGGQGICVAHLSQP